MTYTLRILPAADRDIDEAARFIAQDNLDHALRLYDAVEVTFRMLSEQPQQWPLFGLDHPRLRDIRRCWVSGFRNPLVFYRVQQNVVEVVRVLHGARDIPAILHEHASDESD